MGKKGPVFVAMFKPLQIVFAVIMGITFLGDYILEGIHFFICLNHAFDSVLDYQ